MATTDLSIPQRAALLSLMVAGREVPNPELEKAFGVYLKKAHREQLVKLGYVTTRKGARGALVLELTDGGWRACHDQLTAGPPPRAQSLGNTLYTVLGGLAGFLDRSGLRLADVFGDVGDVAAGGVAVGGGPTAAGAVGAVGAVGEGHDVGDVGEVHDVEERVRQAYRKLVNRPRGWVGLAPLRRHLDGIADADVDAALRALFRSQDANLVPESNQKALTDEERRAAVRIGGEDKHLLSIEDA